MPITLTFGARTLVSGRTVLGPLTIPASYTMFRASVDMSQHLNPGVSVTMTVEASFDGGTTWNFVTSATRSGGVVYDDDGAVVNVMAVETDLPQPGNAQRRLRTLVDLSGGSMSTAGGSVVLT